MLDKAIIHWIYGLNKTTSIHLHLNHLSGSNGITFQIGRLYEGWYVTLLMPFFLSKITEWIQHGSYSQRNIIFQDISRTKISNFKTKYMCTRLKHKTKINVKKHGLFIHLIIDYSHFYGTIFASPLLAGWSTHVYLNYSKPPLLVGPFSKLLMYWGLFVLLTK